MSSFLITACVIAASCSTLSDPGIPPKTPDPSQTQLTIIPQPPENALEAQLIRVVDGDTIRVRVEGVERPLRYIGMDTPERGDCLFRQAVEANSEILAAGALKVGKDISEADRYGRLLRYVWAGRSFVNAELVRQGFAQTFTYPPDVAYASLFLALQRDAHQGGVGLWNPAACP